MGVRRASELGLLDIH